MQPPDYERSPLPPGQNPYRIKGGAYAGHLAYVAEKISGGIDAMLGAIVDPALAQFFRQTFLAASYYDLFPLVSAGHVCAKLIGTTFENFVRVRSGYQAERDVRGIYKMLVKLTSPEAVALRLPRLVAQYVDFGTAEAHVLAPGHVAATQTGTPRAVARWFQLVHDAYYTVLLPMTGAKNVLYRADPRFSVDETRDGIDLVTLREDVFWQE
jgi:hypothetical protein